MGKTPSLSLTHTPTITIFERIARTGILLHHCTCCCRRRKTRYYTSRSRSKRVGSKGSSAKTYFCCCGQGCEERARWFRCGCDTGNAREACAGE